MMCTCTENSINGRPLQINSQSAPGRSARPLLLLSSFQTVSSGTWAITRGTLRIKTTGETQNVSNSLIADVLNGALHTLTEIET